MEEVSNQVDVAGRSPNLGLAGEIRKIIQGTAAWARYRSMPDCPHFCPAQYCPTKKRGGYMETEALEISANAGQESPFPRIGVVPVVSPERQSKDFPSMPFTTQSLDRHPQAGVISDNSMQE